MFNAKQAKDPEPSVFGAAEQRGPSPQPRVIEPLRPNPPGDTGASDPSTDSQSAALARLFDNYASSSPTALLTGEASPRAAPWSAQSARKPYRIADRNVQVCGGPPAFQPTGETFEQKMDVVLRRYDPSGTYAEVEEDMGEVQGPSRSGWIPTKSLVERLDVSKFAEKGTLSEVSYGETNGLYPTGRVEYDPELWDAALTGELLSARRAVHEVGDRGERVHRARPPNRNAVEQRLRRFHLTENFPGLDAEIADPAVRYFYLSKNPQQERHPGLAREHVRVKSYGPFFNTGGGDVGAGAGTYIHFFKAVPGTR